MHIGLGYNQERAELLFFLPEGLTHLGEIPGVGAFKTIHEKQRWWDHTPQTTLRWHFLACQAFFLAICQSLI